MYDPLKLAKTIEEIVTRDNKRKYYRFRADRWYGGIATADCVGCMLKCVFCWSGEPRDDPQRIGEFYGPEQVFDKLRVIARKKKFTQLRISGNEPTIGRRHLLSLLELVDKTSYIFILETSGVLIGSDPGYAEALSDFKNLRVRVSLKGTNSEEFTRLTGALPEAFDLQLKALQHLLEEGVKAHPAVMRSFSTKENYEALLKRLWEIDPRLPEMVEDEYVFLYPIVVERLKKAGIKPYVCYTPSGIPAELV